MKLPKEKEYDKECKYCGQKFTTLSARQIFCGQKCRNELHNLRSFRVPISLTAEQRKQVIDLIDSFNPKQRSGIKARHRAV